MSLKTTSWFFYAALEGEKSITVEEKWFECVVDAKQLLSTKIARNNVVELNAGQIILELLRYTCSDGIS